MPGHRKSGRRVSAGHIARFDKYTALPNRHEAPAHQSPALPAHRPSPAMAGSLTGSLGHYKYDRAPRDRLWALAYAALWAACLAAGVYAAIVE